MNKKTILFLLTIFILMSSAWAQRIEMEPGEQRTIFFPGLKRVDYTGPIMVEQVGNKLLIIARSAGSGSIVATTIHGVETREVVVYARNPQKIIDELKELLKGTEGIRFRKAGGRVIVEGKLYSDSDRIVFSKIISLYPDIINMVEASDLLIEVSVLLIEVESQSMTSVSILENTGIQGDASLRGLNYFEPPYLDPSISLSWGASVRINDVLSTLIESKKAKVVGNPRVVTISGKKATILTGGEVPYQTVGTAGVGVEWKKYGLKLEVTPERRPAGEIYMDIHIESSEPTTTTFGPSLTSRSADLQISIKNRNSLIVSGLFNKIKSSSTKGGCMLPFFGFSSQKINKEILILVTPNAPPTLGYDDFKEIKREDIEE